MFLLTAKMAFALYLRRTEFQPEPPQILDRNIQDPNVKFTYVDFIPGVIKRSGTVIPQPHTEYHSFSAMIEIINEWLAQHGQQWQIVNCETITNLFKYNDIQNCYELRPNDCYFYIYGSEKNSVLRAIRLWLRRRIHDQQFNDDFVAQFLCHKDYAPKFMEDMDRFEDLDHVLKRINQDIKTNGLDGKLLAIESVVYDANMEWEINTDLTLATLSTKNVFVLRLYYEMGPKTFPKLGIVDFHPKQLTRATFFKRPKYETFDQVIDRSIDWLRQNSDKQLINAQSIDVKMKSSNQVDSRQMTFTEHGNYMRVFRVAFLQLEQNVTIKYATKLFLPIKRSETLDDINKRLSDWLNQYYEKLLKRIHQSKVENEHKLINYQTFPMILTAETVEVYSKDVRYDNNNRLVIDKAANEDTFLANRFGNKNAYLFFSFRLIYGSPEENCFGLIPSDSVTNITVVSDDSRSITTGRSSISSPSNWSLDTLISKHTSSSDRNQRRDPKFTEQQKSLE